MANDEPSSFFSAVTELRQRGAARPGMHVLSYALDEHHETLKKLCTFVAKAEKIMDDAMAAIPQNPGLEEVVLFPRPGIFTFGEPQDLYLTTNTPELHSAVLTTMGRPKFQMVVQPA